MEAHMPEQPHVDDLNRRVMGIPNYIFVPFQGALAALIFIPVLMYAQPRVLEDFPWMWGVIALLFVSQILLFRFLRKKAFKLRAEAVANGGEVDGASDRAADEQNQSAVKRRR